MEHLSGLARRHAGWSQVAFFWLVALSVTLWGTGVVMHTWARDAALDMPAWQENLVRVCTIVHGVLTWLFCIFAGRWVWPHAVMVWRRRFHLPIWVAGIAVLGLGLGMSVAGLTLLYGPADWHDQASALHWWLGLVWPLLLAGHAFKRLFRRR